MEKWSFVLGLAALLALSCESRTPRTEEPMEACQLVTVPATSLPMIEDNAEQLLSLYRSVADAPDAQEKARLLRQAAGITFKPSVRHYLLTLSEDLQEGKEALCQQAWLQSGGSQMDLLLTGPVTRILLHHPERTLQLRRMAARLPEFQASLPCDEDILDFLPEENADLISCDVVYCGGGPTGTREVIGSRTLLFDNLIKEQYNRTVFPAGLLLLQPNDQVHLDASAFYWNLVFREMAKGLGVQETQDGVPVEQAIGKEADILDNTKASVLGAYFCMREVEARRVNALIQKADVLATFITDVIRQSRLGLEDASGKVNLIVYNYLAEQGALIRQSSGQYTIDYAKTAQALERLGGHILQLQANGNAKAAARFIQQYALIPSALKADFARLDRERIPIDIRLTS